MNRRCKSIRLVVNPTFRESEFWVTSTCVEMFTDPFKGQNTEILENEKSMDFKWNGQSRKMEKSNFKMGNPI